jgi:hypothetical protein
LIQRLSAGSAQDSALSSMNITIAATGTPNTALSSANLGTTVNPSTWYESRNRLLFIQVCMVCIAARFVF